jgi:DNA-binding MarR family transcriptional regulator
LTYVPYADRCAGFLQILRRNPANVKTIPDPAADRIITTLTLARQSVRLMVDELVARLHAAGYGDITAAHQAVFENIDRHGTRLTTLAARSGMAHQSMSELVHALERAGYLERRPDPADGRARIILLTERGRALVRQALHDIGEIEATWNDQFRAAGHDIDLRSVIEPAFDARSQRPSIRA